MWLVDGPATFFYMKEFFALDLRTDQAAPFGP